MSEFLSELAEPDGFEPAFEATDRSKPRARTARATSRCRIRRTYRFVIAALATALLSIPAQPQSGWSKVAPHSFHPSSEFASSMPSNEGIGDLLSKAGEYVGTYRQTFVSARPSLAKAPTPDSYEKAIELSKQADRKSGKAVVN